MTSPDVSLSPASPLVAEQVRREMAAQMKTVAQLGDALGLKDPKSARARWRGTKSYTVAEVDLLAAWLDVPRSQLLDVEAVAS